MTDKKMVSHGFKLEKDGNLRTSFSLKGSLVLHVKQNSTKQTGPIYNYLD